MNVRFRPAQPGDFPDPPAWKSSPFRASYGDTLALLDRELTKLGAHDVVFSIAVGEDEIRLDGQPRANARPTHPGVVVSFESREHGPLRYRCNRFHHWQDNVRAIALGLEALRKVDRYGITSKGEQYTGWKALPADGDEQRAQRGRLLIEQHGSVRGAEKGVLIAAGIIVAAALLGVGYLLGCRDGVYVEDEAAEWAFDQGYRLGEAKGYATGYDRGLEAASPSVVKERP